MHPGTSLETVPNKAADDIPAELEMLDRAIGQVRNDIEQARRRLSSLPEEERVLFDAYLGMLDDDALAEEIRERILEGEWAQGALKQVILEHTRAFEEMRDSYLRERAADVRELGQRVLGYLRDIHRRKVEFPENTVLLGDQVTAAMLATPVESFARHVFA